MKNTTDFLRTLQANRASSEEELVIIEQEIMDIEHAAEFYNLNASQGYKLYRMLHDARCRRRKCKDQIAVSGYVLDSNLKDILSGAVSNRIDGLERRKYSPRVLTELFT